jgi:hypothetical protein
VYKYQAAYYYFKNCRIRIEKFNCFAATNEAWRDSCSSGLPGFLLPILSIFVSLQNCVYLRAHNRNSSDAIGTSAAAVCAGSSHTGSIIYYSILLLSYALFTLAGIALFGGNNGCSQGHPYFCGIVD